MPGWVKETGETLREYWGRGGRRIANRLDVGYHTIVFRATDNEDLKLTDPWDGGEIEVTVYVGRKNQRPPLPRIEFPDIEKGGVTWAVSNWSRGYYVTKIFGEELQIREGESSPPRPARGRKPRKAHTPVPVWDVSFLCDSVEFPRTSFSDVVPRALWWAYERISEHQSHLKGIVDKIGPPRPLPKGRRPPTAPKIQSRFDLIEEWAPCEPT